MAEIVCRNLSKVFGDGYHAVDNINLDIADGEFMILVGPTGCGKSTLLRMIVGLEDITSGDLLIGGERVNDKAQQDRNVSMVFQNYSLYPHLTVFENMALPLRLKHVPDEQIRRRVEEAARLLSLTEDLGRKPGHLSGAHRQRVAMGRAIVHDAAAFLFDEPLSNLDARLRAQMRTEISRIQRDLHTTTVFGTHDQAEAMTLGDRVAVLQRGRLQQVGPPEQLYDSPANLFVAAFIGSPPMNFLPCVVHGEELQLPFLSGALPAWVAGRVENGDALIAGVRPEHVKAAALIEDTERHRGVSFRVRVDRIEGIGTQQYAHVPYEAPDGVRARLAELECELDGEQLRPELMVVLDPATDVRAGEQAELWLDLGHLHLFDPRTGDNLTRRDDRPDHAGEPGAASRILDLRGVANRSVGVT